MKAVCVAKRAWVLYCKRWALSLMHCNGWSFTSKTLPMHVCRACCGAACHSTLFKSCDSKNIAELVETSSDSFDIAHILYQAHELPRHET